MKTNKKTRSSNGQFFYRRGKRGLGKTKEEGGVGGMQIRKADRIKQALHLVQSLKHLQSRATAS